MLNERLKYLHKLPQDFMSKRLAMINKDRNFFQYKWRFSMWQLWYFREFRTAI